VFVYCQQNWQRQPAHTISSKYILEQHTQKKGTTIFNHLGGEGAKGDVIIVGGAFEELGNAAFGHLYMIAFFVSLFLVVFLTRFFSLFFLFQHWDWLYRKKAYS
jgi:hypothetical protein